MEDSEKGGQGWHPGRDGVTEIGILPHPVQGRASQAGGPTSANAQTVKVDGKWKE